MTAQDARSFNIDTDRAKVTYDFAAHHPLDASPVPIDSNRMYAHDQSVPDANPRIFKLSTKFACTGQNRPAGDHMLNLGSFNIGKENDAVKAQKVAEFFNTYDLDVIGLQELYRYGDDDKQDVVLDIPVEFSKRFPEKTLYYYSKRQRTEHSLMIVSKFPITDERFIEIAGGRMVIHARLTTPFGTMRFFNTHLQRKEDAQCEGLRNALGFIAQTNVPPEPYVLVGDYNLEKKDVFGKCGPIPAETLAQTCMSTPCTMDGIDFILGSKHLGPAVFQVCKFASPLTDSHELYVSTIKL